GGARQGRGPARPAAGRRGGRDRGRRRTRPRSGAPGAPGRAAAGSTPPARRGRDCACAAPRIDGPWLPMGIARSRLPSRRFRHGPAVWAGRPGGPPGKMAVLGRDGGCASRLPAGEPGRAPSRSCLRSAVIAWPRGGSGPWDPACQRGASERRRRTPSSVATPMPRMLRPAASSATALLPVPANPTPPVPDAPPPPPAEPLDPPTELPGIEVVDSPTELLGPVLVVVSPDVVVVPPDVVVVVPDVVVVPEVVVVDCPGPHPVTQNTLYLVSAPWEPSALTVSLTWNPSLGWGSVPVKAR